MLTSASGNSPCRSASREINASQTLCLLRFSPPDPCVTRPEAGAGTGWLAVGMVRLPGPLPLDPNADACPDMAKDKDIPAQADKAQEV